MMLMITEAYLKVIGMKVRDERGRFISPIPVVKRCSKEEGEFALGTIFMQEEFFPVSKKKRKEVPGGQEGEV